LASSAGGAGTADRLAWRACGDMECASLEVPLRYDGRGKATLTLATARVRARDASRRLGALVVNFGGPGSSGRDYLVDFARSLPGELRDRFDIVLYDPRGVGDSDGINCGLDIPALLDFDDRVDRRSPRVLLRESWKLIEPCLERDRATIPHLGTANAARDLDRLRAALGDDRLTYLGFSYGTRLGSVYAHLFPRRVRALVLDGAVTPSADWRKLSLDGAAASEGASRRFFDDCRDGCGTPAVGPLWRRAVERLAREKLVVDGHRIGPAYLELVAALSLGAGRSEMRTLAQLVEDVATEDDASERRSLGAILASTLEQIIGNGAEVAARVAISCADDPARPGFAEIEAFDRLVDRRYPITGSTADGACPPRWPAAIDPLPAVTAAGAPPIVVVGRASTPSPRTAGRWSLHGRCRAPSSSRSSETRTRPSARATGASTLSSSGTSSTGAGPVPPAAAADAIPVRRRGSCRTRPPARRPERLH
ncbi:MAG: alpha/beta hydrolase, partial [Actinobacteria bacterium]|nr:alpha/beta hydrolase [Actinomycetota bacterium]